MHTRTYTQAGRLQTDPLDGRAEFVYAVASRITAQTYPDKRTVAFSCDPNSNLTPITPPGHPAHHYGYDQADQAVAYTPPEIGEYSYDTALRLTTLGLPDGSLIGIDLNVADRPRQIHHPLGALSYDYQSGTGRLAAIQTHDGITLDYQYDGPLPTAVSWTGPIFGSYSIDYDNNLRPTRTYVNDTYPIGYSYDHDGLLTFAGDLYLGRNRENGQLEHTLLGNIAATWTHNTFAEPIHYEARFGTDSLYQIDFIRDPLGRITQRTETVNSTTKTIDYTYDLAGRLQSETINGSITTYSYDDNGNRLHRIAPDGTEIGTYDDQDRALSYGDFDYSYSPNGWAESKTNRLNGQITTYNYDVFGSLRSVALPDGRDIEYLIDGQNRRIGKIVDGVLEKGWLYAGQLNPIAQTDGAGNVTQRFVYGSRANVPDYLIDVTTGRTLQIISDHLGSPRLVVDVATGEIVQRMEHDAWGRVVEDTNSGWMVFGFAGGIWDPDTGLVRFGARDYDPVSGRWLAKDPAEFDGGLNLYQYSENDPINLVDLNGEHPILVAIAIGALVGAGIDMLLQLATNGGDLGCINWGQVGTAAAVGGAMSGVGAGISALGRGMLAVRGGTNLAARFGTTAERVAVLQRAITAEGGLNTSATVARQLAGQRSFIPTQSILDTIGSGARVADPQGVANQFMYRSVASFNGSQGSLEVLLHEASGQIHHVLFRSGVAP